MMKLSRLWARHDLGLDVIDHGDPDAGLLYLQLDQLKKSQTLLAVAPEEFWNEIEQQVTGSYPV